MTRLTVLIFNGGFGWPAYESDGENKRFQCMFHFQDVQDSCVAR